MRRRLLLVIAVVITCAGCWPGQEGWYCDSSSECRGGRVCKTMQTGGGGSSSICVDPSATGFRGKTSGWPMFIGGIAILGGIPLIATVVSLFARAKRKRLAAIEAARPRIPQPPGPPAVCPTCVEVAQAFGARAKPPYWQELTGNWWCYTCRKSF